MKVKFYATLLVCVGIFLLASSVSAQLKPETMRQIQSLLDEKASRTTAQKKVGSQLLQAVRESHGKQIAPDVHLDPIKLEKNDGRVNVDINTTKLTDALISRIESLGGKVIFPSKQFNTVRASLPLDAVEKLADDASIKFIQPAIPYMVIGAGENKQRLEKKNLSIATKLTEKGRTSNPSFKIRSEKIRKQVEQYIMTLGSGTVNSEGDNAHRASDTRTTYGYAGQGIKIGVISDSYNNLGAAATDVANGDLPGVGNPFGNTTPVTVVQDYAGSDEGRAMLQIVHDIAPKAQLFFATADVGGPAGFANNILALRNTYNCDIIIDDIFYYNEPAFQDGIIAQAVNTVTASGALYFSSAGNSGSVAKGTQGVWQGDFNDATSTGPLTATFSTGTKAGTIHNFGTLAAPVNGDILLKAAQSYYTMQWSDPYGASTNDYDVFLVSSTGTVKGSSTTTQNGTQDPYEIFATATLVAGDRLVIFKSSTAAIRAIALNSNRGILTVGTNGQTSGHSSAVNAFSVAATPAAAPASTTIGTTAPTGPYPGAFTAANKVEYFSSDGPRRIFYNVDGSPVTPGNILFGTNGGTVRNKPDITAADGVVTTLPTSSGLNPFYGTSAAAPHAGAIAALLKSANPALTPTQVRTILTTTALDIENAGYDITSGFGIVQAFQAMQAVNPTPQANIGLGTVTATEGSFSNNNGSVEPGELGKLVVQLTNPSLANATNVTATVTTNTPGVTITQGTATYGSITAGGNASNTANPFLFAVNSSVQCGTVINFFITVNFSGGTASPAGFSFSKTVGAAATGPITSTLGSTPPTSTAYTATTGTFNTARLNRNTPVSSCGIQKVTPILTSTVGVRAYDAYRFTNTNTADQCVTVTMTAPNGINLYFVAYNSLGFIPTNPAANFLADQGTSAATQSFSFTDTAGKPFTLVVYNITPGSDVGSAYTLNVSLANCAVTPSCAPITITPNTLATGAVGTPYTQAITATGGSNSGFFTYSLTGLLPAGLTFSGNTIAGTPTQAGSFPLTVTATDPIGCSNSKSYTLTVTGDLATSITATAGTPQSTAPGSAFPIALKARVANSSNVPLSGVNVIFTAPTTGASGTFAGGTNTVTVLTDASGIATAPVFTANSTLGAYNVTASVTGVTIPAANFSLSNACASSYVVTSNADSGPGTLREIINNACAGITVTFDPSVTSITLTSGELAITKAITINGPGANLLTISGNFNSRIFNITAGAATVNVSGIRLQNARIPATATLGGGSFLVNNGADAGAVNISNCIMTNNDLTLVANSLGGGVDNEGGTVTIDRCLISNNVTTYRGAAIQNQGYGAMVITNSTITGNTAGTAGIGGAVRSFLPLTITNCTFFGNSALTGGNISVGGGTCTIGNSIIAGGSLTGAGTGPDISGAVVSADYNLIQNTATATFTGTTTHNITGVSPKLLPLANYGGAIPGLLPMSSSPIVDAGNPALLSTATDQRGFTRKAGSSADIGAVETNYAAVVTSGTPQSTPVNSNFSLPLVATVRESGNLIAGDSVTFTAPASGASGLFNNGLTTLAVVTNASGMASSGTFTANSTPGSYNVVGSIGSAFTGLNYSLTNIGVPPIAFTGCPNNNIIVARPGYNIYNNEPVSFYTLDTATGAATLMPGGPLRDSATGKNIDMNGVGLNVRDGFMYGLRDTVVSGGTDVTAMLYRIGSNYVGKKLLNIATIPNQYVDMASGTMDDNDNFYFIAVTGTGTSAAFTPTNYYLGKFSGVSTFTGSAASVNYTLLDFNGANCSPFKTNLTTTISTTGANAGTGIQDITYNKALNRLMMYEAFQSPANSGNYVGQLFAINPGTGIVTCYPSTSSFGATNNEVAGISTTASGNLRIFTTNGDIYRSTLSGSDFTGTVTRVGATGIKPLGITGGIRGDLASCNVGPASLPSSIVVGLPNQIVAYPNPARGLTTIAVGQALNNATVRILGAAGNVISEISGVSGLTFQIDMTGKPGGMYTVEVIQGSTTQVAKIIKN